MVGGLLTAMKDAALQRTGHPVAHIELSTGTLKPIRFILWLDLILWGVHFTEPVAVSIISNVEAKLTCAICDQKFTHRISKFDSTCAKASQQQWRTPATTVAYTGTFSDSFTVQKLCDLSHVHIEQCSEAPHVGTLEGEQGMTETRVE